MTFGKILTVVSIFVCSASSEYQVMLTCAAPDGKHYQSSTTFTTSDCLLQCVCSPEGHIGCVPLCPDTRLKCPIGYKDKEIIQQAGSEDSGCFCKRIICKPFNNNVAVEKTDYCIERGNYYKPGEEFIRNCTKLCRCYKKGQVHCVPLCPYENHCPFGATELQLQVPAQYSHGECMCKTSVCNPRLIQVEDKCLINGRSYNLGEDFVSADCTGYCKCKEGGVVLCVSLCPPEAIKCQHHEKTIELSRKVPNSDCTCPTWRCLKRQGIQLFKKRQDKCIVGDYTYKPGDDFFSSDCSGYCKCYSGGSVVCASLCTPEIITCQPDEDKINSSRKIPNSNCTCPTSSCLKRRHQDKCIDGKNIYKPGDDFVMPDCSGYCKCHPGGGIGCVSLCPPEGITCQQNEDRMQSLRKIPNSNCTCPTWSCLKKGNQDKKTCIPQSRGNVYQIGQVFSDKNCTLQCHCEDNGKITCRPLCPNTGDWQLDCVPEMQQVLHDIKQFPDAEGKTCSCQVNICRPIEAAEEIYNDKCIDGKNIYKPGDKFVMSDCSGYCKCQPGGGVHCVSLCPPMGIKCQQNEDKMQSLRKISNSNCTCPTWSCLKKRNQDKCIDGKNIYKPGNDFVSSDCSGYCKCHPGGGVLCVSLCPPERITCQQNEDRIQSLKKIPNSNCTCPAWKCVKRNDKRQEGALYRQEGALYRQDKCIVGENTYNPGDNFVSADCFGYCKCHPGGSVHCVNLCPEDGITCQQNEDSIQGMRKIPDSNCTCPTWKCEKKIPKLETCVVDEHSYNLGDGFVSADCSGYCKCHPGGSVFCVSLCPPEGITCQHNEDAIQLSRKIPNSNCTCPTWRCLRKSQQDLCVVDGHAYKPGETFISKDCSSHCKCLPGHGVVCEMLCPPKEIICPFDEAIERTLEIIPNSNCKCPKAKCVKKKSDEFCDIDGVKYKIGQRFVDRNCTGYCKCFGPTAVGCVSLCPPRFYGPCKHGETQVETVRTVLDSHCTCPVSKCVKGGNWTLWSHWTPCDVSCGGGLRRRYRSCSVSGMCVGPTTETEVCNLIPCTPSYDESPCGSIRMRFKVGGSWPRCDDDGFFARLQCNPITSQCWCVDKWGVEEQGSRMSSQIPQCKNKLILGDSP